MIGIDEGQLMLYTSHDSPSECGRAPLIDSLLLYLY